ncbi:hypothetical protein H4582DRAFT_2032881 [Lactarius indigo]|nr:hypothetical protein H4582DRAFT_2032881 [Lactarius indigo]
MLTHFRGPSFFFLLQSMFVCAWPMCHTLIYPIISRDIASSMSFAEKVLHIAIRTHLDVSPVAEVQTFFFV